MIGYCVHEVSRGFFFSWFNNLLAYDCDNRFIQLLFFCQKLPERFDLIFGFNQFQNLNVYFWKNQDFFSQISVSLSQSEKKNRIFDLRIIIKLRGRLYKIFLFTLSNIFISFCTRYNNKRVIITNHYSLQNNNSNLFIILKKKKIKILKAQTFPTS